MTEHPVLTLYKAISDHRAYTHADEFPTAYRVYRAEQKRPRGAIETFRQFEPLVRHYTFAEPDLGEISARVIASAPPDLNWSQFNLLECEYVRGQLYVPYGATPKSVLQTSLAQVAQKAAMSGKPEWVTSPSLAQGEFGWFNGTMLPSHLVPLREVAYSVLPAEIVARAELRMSGKLYSTFENGEMFNTMEVLTKLQEAMEEGVSLPAKMKVVDLSKHFFQINWSGACAVAHLRNLTHD